MATHALFDGAQSDVVHVITPCDVSRVQQPLQATRPQASLSVIRRSPSRETAVEPHNAYGQSDEDFESSTFSVLSVCFKRVEVSRRRLQVASSLVLMPLLLALVWSFPVETTVLLVTLAAGVGYYEFAWIAFRIQSRVLETYRYYEGEGSKKEQRHRLATRVTVIIRRDTRAGVGGQRTDQLQQQIPVPELSKIYPRHCAVWLTSEKFCRGNQWIAALVLALPLAALLVAIDVFVIERLLLTRLPREVHSSDVFRWIFLVSTRFVASVGALFCPNWEYVVLLVFEMTAFSAMTSQTLLCPMGNFECPGRDGSATITIFATLTIAAAGVLLLTVLSSVDAIEVVVKGMLHLVGFALVFVLALSILTLVDTVAIRASHGSLVALLAVTWAGDCSAFLWNLVRRSTRLCGQSPPVPQVDPRRDVECTLVAIGSGALVMAVLTQVTVLPRGSVGVQIALAIGAITFGRMGNLVMGVLKKAAGVRRSGRLFPGLGGVLDQTVPLSFVALVFAEYAGQL